MRRYVLLSFTQIT